VRYEAQLDAPVSVKDPALGTVRAHLTKLAAGGSETARRRLEAPEPPDDLLYLLPWADELARGRRVGMNGPETTGWADLHAWALLTGRQLEPHEASALILIDSVRLHPGDLLADVPGEEPA
jgi:hypothetical protein